MTMMLMLMFLLLANACDGFISLPYSNTKSMSIEYTHIHSHISNVFDEQGDDAINDISINVQRILPNVTPYEARDAWIEYHWIKGGGLPIAILNKDVIKQSTTNNENQIVERTILPILMKERLEYNNDNDTSSTTLHYRVTEAGPFFADLVDGSHYASVSFDSTKKDDSTIDNGCIMTWNVTFATTRLASVYEKVTQFTVGTAATTVQEAAADPIDEHYNQWLIIKRASNRSSICKRTMSRLCICKRRWFVSTSANSIRRCLIGR